MQRYTMLRDGTICYRTDEVEEDSGQPFRRMRYYEGDDAYADDAWVRYEDAAALEQRAEQAEAERDEDADLRRIEAESRDRGHAAARMRLYNEARQAEAQLKTFEAIANANLKQAEAERDEARQQATSTSYNAMQVMRDKDAQIAALQAVLTPCLKAIHNMQLGAVSLEDYQRRLGERIADLLRSEMKKTYWRK